MWKTILVPVLLTAAPAVAHHAVNVTYDTETVSTVEGVVVEVFWRNPHVVLTIERTLENGEREVWEVESGSTNSLERVGIGRDIVAVGDTVALTGSPSRRGLTTLAAYLMTLADGTEIPLWPQRAALLGTEVVEAPISDDARQQSEQEAQGIFRVWTKTTVNMNATLPFTGAAVAARASFDPLVDDPALRCIPPGMPGMMDNPYPIEFVDQGDRLLLRLEEWDGERIIHLTDDPSSAAGQPASPAGYSSGRWEGNTLVVTTTGINEVFFDDIGTPQSAEVGVVERFTLSEANDRIDYQAVLTDPGTFVEPATLTATWIWNPGEEIKPFQCATPGGGGQ